MESENRKVNRRGRTGKTGQKCRAKLKLPCKSPGPTVVAKSVKISLLACIEWYETLLLKGHFSKNFQGFWITIYGGLKKKLEQIKTCHVFKIFEFARSQNMDYRTSAVFEEGIRIHFFRGKDTKKSKYMVSDRICPTSEI